MKLSILIAAYNVEKFIKKCINSCFDEQYAHLYEIIVVNDGSTDTTLKIINALLPQISNLKIINQENRGLGAARNTGIENACGEYIWMIDGDDYIENDYLYYLLKELNSEIQIFVINYKVVNENLEIFSLGYNNKPFEGVIDGGEFYYSNFAMSYTVQFIFLRSIFLYNNLKFKERINMQDSEILPRILRYVKTMKFLNYCIYNYVQHPDSFTNTNNPAKRINYFNSIIEVKKSLEKLYIEIDKEDEKLKIGITNKLESINNIVFNHLIHFKYDKVTFFKIIDLLRDNSLYPLRNHAQGKMKYVKLGLNTSPFLTKIGIDFVIANKKVNGVK